MTYDPVAYGHCLCEAPALPLADRPVEPVPYDGPPLEDRDKLVLDELAQSADGQTAFQGLRRRLGLHQQALTRTLRRLERQGAVERGPDGYALTEQGKAAVGGRALARPRADLVPLLQALLPPSVTADDVADRLARRWFRELRWYGRKDTHGEVALSWLTTDRGALVRVRFARGLVVLEVELGPDESLDRFPAAQAVLKAVAELYAATPEAASGPEALGPGHAPAAS